MVLVLPLTRISPEPVEPCNDVFMRLFNKVIDSDGCSRDEIADWNLFPKTFSPTYCGGLV